MHGDALHAMRQRELFNFLVITADYVVKIGAAAEDGQNNLQPNLIDPAKIQAVEENIRRNTKFDVEIMLSDSEPPGGQTCIYRLVVEKNSQDIKKLYVCGGYANP